MVVGVVAVGSRCGNCWMWVWHLLVDDVVIVGSGCGNCWRFGMVTVGSGCGNCR